MLLNKERCFVVNSHKHINNLCPVQLEKSVHTLTQRVYYLRPLWEPITQNNEEIVVLFFNTKNQSCQDEYWPPRPIGFQRLVMKSFKFMTPVWYWHRNHVLMQFYSIRCNATSYSVVSMVNLFNYHGTLLHASWVNLLEVTPARVLWAITYNIMGMDDGVGRRRNLLQVYLSQWLWIVEGLLASCCLLWWNRLRLYMFCLFFFVC